VQTTNPKANQQPEGKKKQCKKSKGEKKPTDNAGEGTTDPGGYRGPPTFSKWLKTVFWPFWQFTIFNRFSLPGPF
jgi:hypothetical protein